MVLFGLSHCHCFVAVVLSIQNEKHEKGQELALEIAFGRVFTLKDSDEPHVDDDVNKN